MSRSLTHTDSGYSGQIICENCLRHAKEINSLHLRKESRVSIPAKQKAPISSTSKERLKLTIQASRLKCYQLETEFERMQKSI